jgi:hypothetical protein
MRFRTLLTTASALALGVGMMASSASAGGNDLVIDQVNNNNIADATQVGSNNGAQSRNLSSNMWATENDIVNAAGAPNNQNNQIVKQATRDVDAAIEGDGDTDLTFLENAAFNALNDQLRTNKISQGGNSNKARLTSVGDTNFFQVTQDGGDRLGGFMGESVFTQKGNKNVLLADQSGVNGLGTGGSTIGGDQIGFQNIAAVVQTGGGSAFNLEQLGGGNTVVGLQTDGTNTAKVMQDGADNKARSIQTTAGNGFVSQNGGS